MKGIILFIMEIIVLISSIYIVLWLLKSLYKLLIF